MNNGRRYSQKIKLKARMLRSKGQTHREIAKELGIAVGTIWLWTKGIILTSEQKKAIEERRNRFSPNFNTEKRRAQARINLSPYWKPTPTKEELLQRITNFYKKQGRIPFKREFNNTYKEYRKKFGSWNNAIKLAGFSSNPVIFSKKFVAKDGHICDSFAEKIIDDCLFKYKIKHERNLPYKNTKMTADFTVKNFKIEYFGLFGEIKGYDDIIQRKQKICQKENLELIGIYPPDLFSKNFKNYLREIVKKLKK